MTQPRLGTIHLRTLLILMFPFREVKINQDSLPWVNRDIRRDMNTRFKLLKSFKGPQSSSHLWTKYKESRNKVTYLLRKAETEHWRENSVNPETQRILENRERLHKYK